MGNQANILDEQIEQIEKEINETKIEIADLFVASRQCATFENLTNPKKFAEAVELTSKMNNCLSKLDVNNGKLETLLLCRTQLENNAIVA